jgi:hypothetical protein
MKSSVVNMPKVVTIILNWNGLEDTLECIDSLYNMDYLNNEIIVVDNGSSDGSVQIIRQRYPFITIIPNGNNLGFAMGNNVGIRRALDMDADYIWCLNNDTVVAKDTLAKLVNTLQCIPKIGLISPLIYYYDNPDKVQFCGSYIDWEKKSIIKLKNLSEIKEIMSISLWGTALLIRREVIEHVGYLNEKYFAYHEDEEYSMRVLKAGFHNLVHPDAKIHHKNSRSTGSNDAPMQVFLRSRNSYFLWMDNGKGIKRLNYMRRYLAQTISYGGELKEKHLSESIEACLDGVWHAFRGVGGPRNLEVKMPNPIKYVFKFLIRWHPYFWADLLTGNVSEIYSEMVSKVKKKIES